MAIYKPTYCYPSGGNVDFCVDPDTKAIYLQCKVNTSNKKVTGYRLSLTDSSGEEIWSPKLVSSIANVGDFDYGDKKFEDHGTGFNGDVLTLPLVQNFSIVKGTTNGNISPNCLYANVDLSVDYFIESTTNPASISLADLNQIAEIRDWNNTFDDSYNLAVGTRFLIKYSNAYQVWVLTGTALTRKNEISMGKQNVYVQYGVSNHDKVFTCNTSSCTLTRQWLLYYDSYSPDSSGYFYFKSLPLIVSNEYSWKIILYQGSVTNSTQTAQTLILGTSPSDPALGTLGTWNNGSVQYSDEYDINQYDIAITQGQILGSTGSRLQIYPADVVLQGYYVQLGKAEFDENKVVTSWTPTNTRARIEVYDSSYGHIYPQTGKYEENIIEANPGEINACMVFKHSNDPTEVLTSDQVVYATTSDLDKPEIDDVIYHIFAGGIKTLDDFTPEDGNLVLLKDLTGYEYLNGVYAVSTGSAGWKRSGSYDDWADFLGKIILVTNGTQNTNHNFQSQAQVGGTIGAITGSGINAVRPKAASVVVYCSNVDESDQRYTLYSYDNNTWTTSGPLPFDGIKDVIVNTYVLFITETISSSGYTTAPPSLYYVPEEADTIVPPQGDLGSGMNRSTFITTFRNKDICWVREAKDSRSAGAFIKFTQSADSSNWLWGVDSLDSDEKGSNLIFIPEQGVVLYPNYENTSLPQTESIDLVNIVAQDESSTDIPRYNLYNYNWNATDPTAIGAILNCQIDNVDGCRYNADPPYDLKKGDSFLGAATYYSTVMNWEIDLSESKYGYGDAQYLCYHYCFLTDNERNKSLMNSQPPAAMLYSLGTSGSNYIPSNTGARSVTLTSSAPFTVLEYDCAFTTNDTTITGVNGVTYTLYNKASTYWTWRNGPGNTNVYTLPEPIPCAYTNEVPGSAEKFAAYSASNLTTAVTNIAFLTGSNLNYYIVKYRVSNIINSNTRTYVLERQATPVVVQRKVTLRYANASSSTVSNLQLAYVSGALTTATTASSQVYYIGKYTISNITASLCQLTFNAWGAGSTIGTSEVPHYLVKAERGMICGNTPVVVMGTYAEPKVQRGVTNTVGLLNINNENVTYIKPSVNITENQYLIFTEVDIPSRRIVSFDEINYGVQFDKLDGTVTLTANGLVATLYSAPTSGSWDWTWSTGSHGYTKPAPEAGDFIYDDNARTQGSKVIDEVIGVRYPSVTNAAAKTPYKYKIASYFKESDYNAVAYSGRAEVGFCNIYSGDNAYTSMALVATPYQKSFVLDNTSYVVDIDYKITFATTKSQQALRGYYRQGTGKRWEYYRMVIFNADGVSLQDTGNVYDGDFTQIFWGLQPNENVATTRYAMLLVEDEFGQIYTAGVELYTPAGGSVAVIGTSSVKYNYNLQSVDILLTGLDSSKQYSLLRKEPGTLGQYELVDRLVSEATSWNIRDYNITNNRHYQYYLNQDNSATSLKVLTSDVATLGKCWSITELLPIDLPDGMDKSLTIKKKYVVDENNVWLFKYNGEFGSQTQNIAKSEQGTLGRYPRIGQGLRNNQTGSVSGLLGSEILPGIVNENGVLKSGYQERLRIVRDGLSINARTSNASIDMLQAWRSFVTSKNPKLLKDVKGQSWIVQILSSQNTPASQVQGRPDTISFSWTEIQSAKDLIITGDIDLTLRTDYSN